MRLRAIDVACWSLWLTCGVLPAQQQILPCMGPEPDLYLTTAPRAWTAREGVYEPARPVTQLEIGLRQVSGDRDSAKFGEYRDIPRGVFIRNLVSCAETPDGGFYYRLVSRESAEMDQHSLLTTGLPGRLKITAGWDRNLHTQSTVGRNQFEHGGPGEFILPAGPEALLGGRRTNLQFKRNTARIGTKITPNETWELRVDYSHEKRSGFRPTGANVAFSVLELPEPRDFRTQNL